MQARSSLLMRPRTEIQGPSLARFVHCLLLYCCISVILFISFPIHQIIDASLFNATHVFGSRPGLQIPRSVSIDIKVFVATEPKIEVFPRSLTVFKGEKVGTDTSKEERGFRIFKVVAAAFLIENMREIVLDKAHLSFLSFFYKLNRMPFILSHRRVSISIRFSFIALDLVRDTVCT